MLIVLVGWVAAGLPVAALQIRLDEAGAEAAGVTPGGEVAWLTVWRQPDELGVTRVTLLDRRVRDEDFDGAVRLEVEPPIARLSVWVAVDLATGEAAAATLEGVPLRWAPEGSVRLPERGPGVEVGLGRPEMMLVRPGVGAFRARGSDGAHGDAGARGDGRVTVTPAAFRRAVALAGEAQEPRTPPRAFGAGDVLVGIDAGTLEVVYAEVGR